LCFLTYTLEQIRQARQVDLLRYLEKQGYELKKEGQNYRVAGQGGFLVQKNHWKQFSTDQGGNTLDFLIKMEGHSFKEAMEMLLEGATMPENTEIKPNFYRGKENNKKELQLPDRAPNEHRVLAYLNKTRGLSIDMIVQLIKEGLLYQDVRGNCVFVCIAPETGEIKGAALQGTLTDVKKYRGVCRGTDTRFGFYLPPEEKSNVLVITESAIDILSLATLKPKAKEHHMLSLNGLNLEALECFLENQTIKHIVIALDNDHEGIRAAAQLEKKYAFDLKISKYLPPSKDWNEELINK